MVQLHHAQVGYLLCREGNCLINNEFWLMTVRILVACFLAQCILLESLENCSPENELESQELDEICSKMKESLKSEVRQASVWNTLGLLLLRTGRLQVQKYRVLLLEHLCNLM